VLLGHLLTGPSEEEEEEEEEDVWKTKIGDINFKQN
jgi:hypothetical protein